MTYTLTFLVNWGVGLCVRWAARSSIISGLIDELERVVFQNIVSPPHQT